MKMKRKSMINCTVTISSALAQEGDLKYVEAMRRRRNEMKLAMKCYAN
jgi:hypothetical protein